MCKYTRRVSDGIVVVETRLTLALALIFDAGFLPHFVRDSSLSPQIPNRVTRFWWSTVLTKYLGIVRIA